MWFCSVRNIRDHRGAPLYVRNCKMRLPEPQRSKRHHEHAHPFQPVPCPTRKHTAERYISGSTGKPQRLTRRALPNFPDKSVIIKMQQRRGGYQPGENPFDGLHPDMRVDEGNRAVGKDEADIKANQRAAPSEHESHESANIAVLLNPISIVDPDERQVLHVVKYFEQRNPNEDV